MTFRTNSPKMWLVMKLDYKELYYELFRATEKAINVLIDAQQRCEEKVISEPEIIKLFDIKAPRSDE